MHSTYSIILYPANYTPCLNSLGLPLCFKPPSLNPPLLTLSFHIHTHPPRNVYNSSNTNHLHLGTRTQLDIPGNEKADKAAKDATHQSTIPKSLLPSYSDLFYHIKKFINQHWFALWEEIWGTTKKSNREVILRAQNKVLQCIGQAPWFVSNVTLHRDLRMDSVRKAAVKYSNRLHSHSNNEAGHLTSR